MHCYVNGPQWVMPLTSHSLVCSSPYWFWGCLWDLLCPLRISISTSSRDLMSICALGHNMLKPSPWVRTSELDTRKGHVGKNWGASTGSPGQLLYTWVRPARTTEILAHLLTGYKHMNEPSCHCVEEKQAVCPREPCLDCQTTESWANKSCLGFVDCAAIVN